MYDFSFQDRSSSDEDEEGVAANVHDQTQTIHANALRIPMRSTGATFFQAMSAPGPSSSRQRDRRAIPILRFIGNF